MRIENLLLNNFIIENKEEMLKEGEIFKGKILELMDNLILIEVKGRGVIQGKLEPGVKLLPNEELTFLVKANNNDEVLLKPLAKDKALEVQLAKYPKDNNPISSLLKNLNIKETKISNQLVESLMKYNIPLSEKNITEGVKTLEKLLQLSNLEEDKKVVLISQETINSDLIPEKEIVNNEGVKKNIPQEKEEPLSEENVLENKSIEKPLIEKEAVDSKDLGRDTLEHPKLKEDGIKDTNLEKSISNEKNLEDSNAIKSDIKNLLVIDKEDLTHKRDISKVVKEFLGNKIDSKSEGDHIKIISFLLKNDLKTSLNNIKSLKEFNKDPIQFLEELKSNSLNLKEDAIELKNKIDFLEDMNKNLSFNFNQIHYKDKGLDGLLTLIKERKSKKNYNDRLNVYINLDTNNLGNIRVSCQLISNALSVRMNVRDSDVKLFKDSEKQLVEKLSLIGYSLDKIDFVVDNNIELIDIIISNPNPTYILDMKV